MYNIQVKPIPSKNFRGDWLQVHFSAVRKTDNAQDDFKNINFSKQSSTSNENYDYNLLYKNNFQNGIDKFQNLFAMQTRNSNTIAPIKYLVAKGKCMSGLIFNNVKLPEFDTNTFGVYEDLTNLKVIEVQQVNGENHTLIYANKEGKSGYYIRLFDYVLIIDSKGQIKCRLLTQIMYDDGKITIKTKYKDNGDLVNGKEHDISDIVGCLVYIDCE